MLGCVRSSPLHYAGSRPCCSFASACDRHLVKRFNQSETTFGLVPLRAHGTAPGYGP